VTMVLDTTQITNNFHAIVNRKIAAGILLELKVVGELIKSLKSP